MENEIKLMQEQSKGVNFMEDSNLKPLRQSQQSVNGMKGSILKSPNSPKKGGMTPSQFKKVSVRENPDVLYVEKYQNKNKKCTCICNIF